VEEVMEVEDDEDEEAKGWEEKRKFPLLSTESIFLSSNKGLAPPVNLNLHMLTFIKYVLIKSLRYNLLIYCGQ